MWIDAMKNMTSLFILLLSLPVFALKIPGSYRCTQLRMTRIAGTDVYSKGFATPSLYLNFKPGSITLSGQHADIYLSEKITISNISGDSIFVETTLRDKKEKTVMVSSGDTLSFDFLFENEEASFQVYLLMILEPVKKAPVKNRSSIARRDSSRTGGSSRDLLGRSKKN